MKAPLITILFFIVFSVYSQNPSIKVNPSTETQSEMTLDELVENVLLYKSCSNALNFEYSGSDDPAKRSYGYFSYSGSEFPFSEGIILGTGNVAEAEGPNTVVLQSGNLTKDKLGLEGHDDLTMVLNDHFKNKVTTEDVTYVKFDFIPTSDHISFNYVLASEEWESASYECPGTGYMDGFAFIISGPGITPQLFDHDGDDSTPKKKLSSGGRNIATFKDEKTGKYVPVSIGNIYNNPKCVPPTSNANNYISYTTPEEKQKTSPIQFNARTTVLTAESDVIPGETYSIMLMLGDRSDGTYNTAIFLEAYSFNLGMSFGEDLSFEDGTAICGDEYTLDAGKLANAKYTWYFNGQPIEAETSQTYTARPAPNGKGNGKYSCKAYISKDCQPEDEITIEFDTPPVVQNLPDVEICSDDGIVSVDLSEYDSVILDDQANSKFEIKYYASEDDLLDNTASISKITTKSFEKTPVYVLVKKNGGTCSGTTTFSITPVKAIEIGELQDVRVCDDGADGDAKNGKSSFDFSQNESDILPNNINPSDYEISYYLSKEDADAKENALQMPHYNETQVFSQEIFIRVESKDNCDCYSVSSFKYIVRAAPNIKSDADADGDVFNDYAVPDYLLCSGETRSVDLTSKNTEILNGESASDMAIHYYETKEDLLAGTNEISNVTDYMNSGIITATQTIYVSVEDKIAGCMSYTQFRIVVTESPVIKDLPDLEICDEDGVVDVNLADLSSTILDGQDVADFDILYFKSETDLLANTSPITTVSTKDKPFEAVTVYVLVAAHKEGTCSTTTQFDVIPVKALALDYVPGFEVCDDDLDGLTTVDFNEQTTAILAGQTGMTVTYYETQEAAEKADNPLSMSYTNVTPFKQPIYIRVESETNKSCYGIASFQLSVYPRPVLNSNVILEQEDEDKDGYADFNLSLAKSQLSDNYLSENFTYYISKEDAENKTNAISNVGVYTNPTEKKSTVWVRVETNSGGCENIVSFTIKTTTDNPEFPPMTYRTCDDYEDGDGTNGISTFDLSTIETQITALFLAYPNIKVTYYKSLEDATQQQNEISSSDLASYRNEDSPNSQKLTVRVDDTGTNQLIVMGEYIELIVNENPEIPQFDSDEITICLEDEIDVKPLNYVTKYTYEWYDASQNYLGQKLNADLLSEDGVYSLKVTDEKGCYSTKSVTITLSQESLLTEEDLVIDKENGVNNLVIPIGVEYGIGDYVYSLSKEGPFSSELDYKDLSIGSNTLYIEDLKGCTLHEVPFNVKDSDFIYMKFFTPNDDGVNDFWNITGAKSSVEGSIKIFDRYGRLMIQIDPKGQGWDGTYKGVLMPSTDYWFQLMLKGGHSKRAHFSLIRK